MAAAWTAPAQPPALESLQDGAETEYCERSLKIERTTLFVDSTFAPRCPAYRNSTWWLLLGCHVCPLNLGSRSGRRDQHTLSSDEAVDDYTHQTQFLLACEGPSTRYVSACTAYRWKGGSAKPGAGGTTGSILPYAAAAQQCCL